MRFLIILLMFVLPLPVAAYDEMPSDVAEFLATRKTLATISFAAGSDTLTAGGRETLDSIVKQLRQTEKQNVIVRIEGFCSPDGEERANLLLAMDRARAVEAYLRTLELPDNRSLMGMGVDHWSGLEPDAQRRVDVAIYEDRFDTNNWETDSYLFQ